MCAAFALLWQGGADVNRALRRLVVFWQESQLYHGDSRTLAVDSSLNFERVAVADNLNPTRFAYVPRGARTESTKRRRIDDDGVLF